MNPTTVTTPSELEIRVERIFDAPRSHVFSVWSDTVMQYGVEEGATSGFAQVDALLQRLMSRPEEVLRNG